MTSKELALRVIEALPESSSLDDILHALYLIATFEFGASEIQEGLGVTDQEARKRLRKWL